MDDSLQRCIRAIVHIRRGELDVAQRRNAKEEARQLRLPANAWIATTGVEGRQRPGSGSELRRSGVRERLAAEAWPIVALRTPRLAEEEQRAALRVDRDRVVVSRQIAVEGRIRVRERLDLERGDRIRRMLKAELTRRNRRIGRRDLP